MSCVYIYKYEGQGGDMCEDKIFINFNKNKEIVNYIKYCLNVFPFRAGKKIHMKAKCEFVLIIKRKKYIVNLNLLIG